MRSLERAIDLDPRNSATLQQIALSYRHLRRFAEEKSVLDRALAIDPNDLDIKLERAALEFYWKADTRPLHQMLDSIRATNPAATRGHRRVLASLRTGGTRCRCRKKCRDRSR